MTFDENQLGKDLPIGSRHYRAFVGPPEKYDLVAAMQFNLLTALGLREFHYMLDIGCGSLRGGRLYISYLLPDRYFGIEPAVWLIDEGVKNECGKDLLKIKRPVFSHDSDFTCTKFNQKFDFILAQSIFSHASQQQIRRCFSQVEKCMIPSSVFAATFLMGTDDYVGNEWVYPNCVTYTLERIEELAKEFGLIVKVIDWPHPNGQTWVLITYPDNGIAMPVRSKGTNESLKIQRVTLKSTQGGVVWFTGIPGAGKTTLCNMVGSELKKEGIKAEILDGDVVRENLCKGLGFSKEDRDTNIRRIGFVAQLLARNGVWVLVSAISPYREIRDEVRRKIRGKGAEFIEVYVRCPLEVAELRDPKGLYKRARKGEIASFTGVSDPYEEPLSPEVIINTDKDSPEECVSKLMNFLVRVENK